ncbi:MAG TPA: aminotransferase class III-fold pyridoxal phosphate-dependent enzyme, partial [Chloroflexia bacterium]|nr:aminotransferase class III-fold pyridoxal phosphate-dependent enzyme [Chloroflexia bacterium]
DLTCVGKVIGSGLPVAAYGGRAEIMRHVAPAGSMYQAGTLCGSPLAMSAGIATLRELQTAGIYERLAETARSLASGFEGAARAAGVPLRATSVGSMWGFFFTEQPVTDYASAKRADTKLYARFFHAMLERGVYLAPSQFEAAFVSTQHDTQEVERTVQAAHDAFTGLSA